MATVHLVIKGKVQGVFFRVSARKAAERAGVKGWVRNTPDGCVEAVAQGSEEQVQKFVEWCKRGPSGAKVEDLLIEGQEEQSYSEFSIRH